VLGNTGYGGSDRLSPDERKGLYDDMWPQPKRVMPHIDRAIADYALKERLFAVRNGHTAVRFSELAASDEGLMAQARQNERLLVLEGKQDIEPADARSILAEAGIEVRSWAKGRRLNPKDAVSMTNGELCALAGNPLPSDGPMASEPIYVPRIPLDAAEADAMLSMSTVFTDMTDLNAADLKSVVRTYAGYTKDELRGGRPVVVVR
jgi:hypothetical protein